MLTRFQRFHGHNSLRGVYQNGASVYGVHMKLLWKQGGSFKAAVVVSKKVHKSAVVRNRIRRRVYEIMRRYVQKETLNAHVVCLVQSEAVATMPTETLQNELEQLLHKVSNSA